MATNRKAQTMTRSTVTPHARATRRALLALSIARAAADPTLDAQRTRSAIRKGAQS